LAFSPFSLTSRTDNVSGYKNLSGSVASSQNYRS
jgi:hypothetical protein